MRTLFLLLLPTLSFSQIYTLDMHVQTEGKCEHKRIEWGHTDNVFYIYDNVTLLLCMDADKRSVTPDETVYICDCHKDYNSDFEFVRVVRGNSGIIIFAISKTGKTTILSTYNLCQEL